MLSCTFNSGVRILQCSRCMQNSPSFSCEQSVMPRGPSMLFQVRIELQLDIADRPVALLGDDDLGLVVHGLAALEPFLVAQVELLLALAFALRRDRRATDSTPRGTRTSPRPRPARSSPNSRRSGQHGALVLAQLDRPRQLGQRQHRNVQILGHGLQALGDLLISCTRLAWLCAPVPRSSCR